MRGVETLRVDRVPGDPSESGFAHGRLIGDLLEPAFVSRYLDVLGEAIGFGRGALREQAVGWFERLPAHFQEEITAMGQGAGCGRWPVLQLLFADIARASSSVDARSVVAGPMCSSIVGRLGGGSHWVARNCDWLTPTLLRGTSAVVHAVPHRIPVMAVGIRGDIDVDTGCNAEGLWLHLHTLFSRDAPDPERPCISWLFWAREALETCASLDELETFIAGTCRDRGVFAIASEGRTGQSAVFECSCASYVRHDVDGGLPMCVTNHTLNRADDGRPRPMASASGTISRRRALLGEVQSRPPERGPDDLMAQLAAEGVEMRTPRWLRTIYSAVVDPASQRIWFASGTASGVPAASRGRWACVRPPWVRRS